MDQTELEHLVVFLPGISGSILEDKHGRRIWDSSHRAVWNAARTYGDSIRDLRMEGADPGTPIHPDGVRAVDLIMDAHLLLGLAKIDGYDFVLDAIRQSFQSVIECLPDDSIVGNLLKFPYDWRRDNRILAGNLQIAIKSKLMAWRTTNPKAKVIIVAHSMGGLIARYYLEVLGGWSDCVGLITLGTPFRGSLNALDFLSNGYKAVSVDVTDILRSFPAMYQLLPAYEAIHDGENDRYIVDCLDRPELAGVNREFAKDAMSFHREIGEAVARNGANPDRYLTAPIVGIRQPTNQLAQFANGRLVVDKVNRPKKVPSGYDGGDGTVPYTSAIPLEQSKVADFRGCVVSDRHAALQKNQFAIENVVAIIKRLHEGDLAEVCGTLERHLDPLRLDLDDAYLANEPVLIRASTGDGKKNGTLRGVIRSIDAPLELPLHFEPDGDHWSLVAIPQLPSGTYRVEVSSGSLSESAISDLFVVCEKDAV